jgi:hypothetical protein
MKLSNNYCALLDAVVVLFPRQKEADPRSLGSDHNESER